MTKAYCYKIEEPCSFFLFLPNRQFFIKGYFFDSQGRAAEELRVMVKKEVYFARKAQRLDVQHRYKGKGKEIDPLSGFELEIELSRGFKTLRLLARSKSGDWIRLAKFYALVSKKKDNVQKETEGGFVEVEDWYSYGATLEPQWKYDEGGHPLITALLESKLPIFEQYLIEWKNFIADFLLISPVPPSDNLSPFWHNRWFDSLDAISLFGMIAQQKPKIFLEIGSGYSTRFAYGAKKAYSPRTKIMTIDPEPRTAVEQLADETFRSTLQSCPLYLFEQLEGGDILFLDGSHRVLQGSDVTVFFLEILPALKPGVIIHLHDIFWPEDYPKDWSKRYYSEQYLLGSLLLFAQEKFEILFASHFVSKQAKLVKIFAELWESPKLNGLKPLGGSFWFRKKS
ncbi:class I SAM-dependent methyltransferase [Methylacidiphilum caldifontis]|uniref:class I SAM-dependent methyltransferase n=1 Tax=Methylacidiphilum caldifontis TaxID=2795386 RepID=UPI00106B3D7D|nr:class I SAM-dependent methyltransferase [Methylacidiphilum caldifontis]